MKEINYTVDDDECIVSYKLVDKDGYDMYHCYRYTDNKIGEKIIDTASTPKELYDPEPHTPGGIYSASFVWHSNNPQRVSELCYYVKIKTHIEDLQLCYDHSIKSNSVRLLEIQGKNLKL
jgi:hypothetical protein